ncbi:MAG: hypothetical protein LBD46_05330 [Endomicrobium sp.]|jgi:uncharacterized protein (DUF1778 family)|nr:hypothetical protein [Endomicrobium sp.]
MVKAKEKATALIQMKVTPEKKRLLEMYAELENRSLSNFLETAGLERGAQLKNEMDRRDRLKEKIGTVKK